MLGLASASKSAIGVSNSIAGKRIEFEGVAYDPVSGEKVGKAQIIKSSRDQMRGTLKLPRGAFRFDFEQPTQTIDASGDVLRKYVEYRNSANAKNALKLNFLSPPNDTVSGTVNHPGMKDKVAFRLERKNAGQAKSSIQKKLNNHYNFGGGH